MALDLPQGQDTSLGLTISDDPSRKYRAMMFVNGWQVGNYVNYVGPQHSFPIPNGILNPNGTQHASRSPCGTSTARTGGLGNGVADQLRQLRVLAERRAERQPGL